MIFKDFFTKDNFQIHGALSEDYKKFYSYEKDHNKMGEDNLKRRL